MDGVHMSPHELMAEATRALEHGPRMTLVLPRKFRKPAGFPRGELLSDAGARGKVWSFECEKVIAWLEQQGAVREAE